MLRQGDYGAAQLRIRRRPRRLIAQDQRTRHKNLRKAIWISPRSRQHQAYQKANDPSAQDDPKRIRAKADQYNCSHHRD